MKNIFRIFRHELRLILREPRFWIPFLIPPLFLLIIQALLLSRYGNQAQVLGEPMVLLTMGALVSTMAVSLTADSFAGERERNTLELLLNLPIPMAHLFWGKLLALIPAPLVFAWSAQFVIWSRAQNPGDLGRAFIYSLAGCLFSTGIALIFSLFAGSVRSAAQSSILFVLVFLFSTQMIAGWYLAPASSWYYLPLGGLVFFCIAVFWGLGRFKNTLRRS
jgi:ABC-type transport system involved in multi-copper enzyme maturation permease subunit